MCDIAHLILGLQIMDSGQLVWYDQHSSKAQTKRAFSGYLILR